MVKFKMKGVVIIILFFVTTISFSQIFGKGNSGFVVLKNGDKLEGFVKEGASTNGVISSIMYSNTADGKYKYYKLKKEVQEYSLNGKRYMKALIKKSPIGGKKERFCGVFYKGPVFTLLYHPDDDFPEENVLNVSTMFYARKNNSKDFHLISILNYKKKMKKLCGDNSDWDAKVASDSKWLGYENRIENFKFYEEKSQN
jgi:hypothetical protein